MSNPDKAARHHVDEQMTDKSPKTERRQEPDLKDDSTKQTSQNEEQTKEEGLPDAPSSGNSSQDDSKEINYMMDDEEEKNYVLEKFRDNDMFLERLTEDAAEIDAKYITKLESVDKLRRKINGFNRVKDKFLIGTTLKTGEEAMALLRYRPRQDRANEEKKYVNLYHQYTYYVEGEAGQAGQLIEDYMHEDMCMNERRRSQGGGMLYLHHYRCVN